MQEALIRRQVEAYAADPSAGASKGQSSIQIRRDWKAKEKQLQVGLLSQLCGNTVDCSCCRTKHVASSVRVSSVVGAKKAHRRNSRDWQMLGSWSVTMAAAV